MIPHKLFGMSAKLFFSILALGASIIVQIVLYMMKKNKTRKLEEMKKQEEEENKRIMEREWEESKEESDFSLQFMKSINTNEIEEAKVYD